MLKGRCFVILLLALFSTVAYGQVEQAPTPERDVEKVRTEEIRINFSARDAAGRFVPDLKKDDIVIVEDGRLHQASSLRRIPPSVVIALDTGGSTRQKKNIGTTRIAAARIAESLGRDSQVRIVDFSDRVNVLNEWTADKAELAAMIKNRTTLGLRSSFTEALDAGLDLLEKAPTENRHFVMITDGLDSLATADQRAEALRRAWRSGVVVHIVSYAQIEFEALKPQTAIWRKGEPNPRRLPDEVMEALKTALPMNRQQAEDFLNHVYPPRLISLIIDIPLIHSRRSNLRALSDSFAQLAALADYSGGMLVAAESLDELIEKASTVSDEINSQYVLSYEPKHPLTDVKADEIRRIEVSSRRHGVAIETSRRLPVLVEAGKK